MKSFYNPRQLYNDKSDLSNIIVPNDIGLIKDKDNNVTRNMDMPKFNSLTFAEETLEEEDNYEEDFNNESEGGSKLEELSSNRQQ